MTDCTSCRKIHSYFRFRFTRSNMPIPPCCDTLALIQRPTFAQACLNACEVNSDPPPDHHHDVVLISVAMEHLKSCLQRGDRAARRERANHFQVQHGTAPYVQHDIDPGDTIREI